MRGRVVWKLEPADYKEERMNDVIELAELIYAASRLPKDMCSEIAMYLVERGCRRNHWIRAEKWPPESDGRYLMATSDGKILVAEWHDGVLSCPCTLTTAVKWFMPAPELPES